MLSAFIWEPVFYSQICHLDKMDTIFSCVAKSSTLNQSVHTSDRSVHDCIWANKRYKVTVSGAPEKDISFFLFSINILKEDVHYSSRWWSEGESLRHKV